MRGELDRTILQEIAERLPDLRSLFRLRSWAPAITSASLMVSGGPNSGLPLAGVCLNDTLSGVIEARYALHEAYAHLVWYREKSSSKPNEPAAVFSAQFYATAAASCLYASGERLADSLIAMLGIDPSILPTSGVSRQCKVAQHLVAQKSGQPITLAVQSLGGLPEWTKSMDLRNRWVHGQPPIIEGTGIRFRRRQQWIQKVEHDEGTIELVTFGGGDDPEYSIDAVVGIVDRALRGFVHLFEFVINAYEQQLPTTLAIGESG